MKNFQDLVQEALKNVPEVDIYQLKEKIESNKQIRLIDIREDREWVSGRIPSAFHIGRGVLEKGIFESLNEMGFNNVFSLKGGITDWITAGFEIEE